MSTSTNKPQIVAFAATDPQVTVEQPVRRPDPKVIKSVELERIQRHLSNLENMVARLKIAIEQGEL